MPGLFMAGRRVVTSGSLAAGNARVSLVNGTAFIDPSGLDLSSYGDEQHLLALYNTSGGYAAIGHIKAAGSGEGLDAEIATSWTNVNFATLTVPSPPNVGQAISGAVNNTFYMPDISTIARGLIKFAYTLTIGSGSGPTLMVGFNTALNSDYVSGYQATGAVNGYYTLGLNAKYVGFRQLIHPGDWSTASSSFKQVLTPSATGVTIVNTQGGTVYNWLYKHASFDGNAAMTYKVFFIGS